MGATEELVARGSGKIAHGSPSRENREVARFVWREVGGKEMKSLGSKALGEKEGHPP